MLNEYLTYKYHFNNNKILREFHKNIGGNPQHSSL